MKKYKIPDGSLISFFSNKVKQHGGINLAQGIPGFEPPIELLDILNSITHEPFHQYAPGNGNLKLLDLLFEKYKDKLKIKKNNFLVVQGVTEAITLLYIYFSRLIRKDFSVLAFDPVYETYNNIPNIFGDNFVRFPFKNNQIKFSKLESVIENENVKILFLASPGNPYGRLFTKKEFKKILQLSEQYGIYVIIDAVYQDLYFSNPPYIPFKKFNSNIFYVNSFSKMFSVTGWRIGYLIASKKHIKAIKSIHDYTGLCAPSILQEALAQYIEQYNYGEKYVENLRSKLSESFTLLKNGLEELGFEIPNIEGGYFVWAKLPNNYKSGFKFAVDLYDKEKVAVIPGIHFSENFKNYVRFNIAQEKETITEALEKIRLFIENN